MPAEIWESRYADCKQLRYAQLRWTYIRFVKFPSDIAAYCIYLTVKQILVSFTFTFPRLSLCNMLYAFCLILPLHWRWIRNWEWLGLAIMLCICLRWFHSILITFWQMIHCSLHTRQTLKPCCGAAGKLHDTVVKFDTYRNLQRHRAVLLRCYDFLVHSIQRHFSDILIYVRQFVMTFNGFLMTQSLARDLNNNMRRKYN